MQIDPRRDEAMLTVLRPRRTTRPWLPLLNAVIALAGEHATLLSHAERPWASVTFSGARHTVVLTFAGQCGALAAERFVSDLPDHEFMIPHKLVADAAIIRVDETMLPDWRIDVETELLLLDDG